MTNSAFWESYKKKCSEKGLSPRHESAEEFEKAMTEPPRPYSTDNLNATTNGSNVDLPKRREWDELMGVEDIEMIEDDDKEEDMAKKVPWQRCNMCSEMKEDSEFAHVRGGGLQKTCKKCMAQKISAGHKKHEKSIDALKPVIEEKKVILPESNPLKPIDTHCDGADAIAFGLSLDVKKTSPLLKEKVPLKAMSEEALRNLLRLAFLAGVESVNTPAPEEVTQEIAMELLNDVITECKRARA